MFKDRRLKHTWKKENAMKQNIKDIIKFRAIDKECKMK